MIESGFKMIIPVLILIGSALMMSSCATTTTSESSASKPVETVSPKIEKAKVDTPVTNEKPPSSAQVKDLDTVKTTNSSAQNSNQTSMQNVSKVSSIQKLVNVRSAPTTKSRVVGVLKGGHSIEILETTDTWVKIKWYKGQTVKQGWMSKRFVEGYEL